MSNSRLKFRYEAHVEYVTEELSHNGSIYFMFNIKVSAVPENQSNPEIMQWSVIKSDDEFMQTLKILKTKYGLLKSFYFRNPSSVGNQMFHLTHPVKPRREKKDEFLIAMLQLDPIPDEASAFLCLENATYFTELTADPAPTNYSGSSVTATSRTSPNTIPNQPSQPTRATSLPTAEAQRSDKTGYRRWFPDAGLLGLVLSFLALTLGAALLSHLAKKVNAFTMMHNKGFLGTLLYVMHLVYLSCSAVGLFLHSHMEMVRVRLEVVVVLAIIYLFAHRVIGYGLGWYLRSMLDPQRTGKFAFHFEWISFRCGLDQNMIVLSGIEWRNPPSFHHTPYLLRIDEISFIVDAASVWSALSRKSAIKIKEIRFNKVVLHMEKYTPPISDKKSSRVLIEAASVVTEPTTQPNTTATTTTTATISTTMKPGVLNLWAAMGATDAAQEKSMLSSISSQMNNAVEGGSSMVGVLTKYNPAALLYKGGSHLGTHIGSTGVNIVGNIGNTIGLGYFTKKHKKGEANGDHENDDADGATAEELQAQEVDLALQQTLQAIDDSGAVSGEEDNDVNNNIDSDTDADENISVESFTDLRHSKAALRSAHSANNFSTMSVAHTNSNNNTTATASNVHSTITSAAATPDTSTTPQLTPTQKNTTQTSLTTNTVKEQTAKGTKAEKADKNASKDAKKGFGVPYLLDIDNLQLDRLELHTQDFLNSTHSDVKYGVIKLKSLSMNRKDLTKPPKNDPTISAAENLFYKNKRRPLFLDDVVWRLVNKLLAELIKNNSIAMMVLLSAAAANNATSVVSSAGNIAYSGAATGTKLLNRAGSVLAAPTKSFRETVGAGHSTSSSPMKPRNTSAVSSPIKK